MLKSFKLSRNFMDESEMSGFRLCLSLLSYPVPSWMSLKCLDLGYAEVFSVCLYRHVRV